jgi:hypothetical protein
MSETPLQAAVQKLEDIPDQTPMTVVKGVTVRRKKNGLTVMRIHYSAIPERDPDTESGAKWKKRESAKYSSQARWKKEQEIDPDATGGEAVFGLILEKYYDAVVITDPHWYPDPRWDVVGAFDHGVVNATCLLKAYVPREEFDRRTQKKKPVTVYLCGEYYSYRRDGWPNTVEQNCKAIMRGGVDEYNQRFEPMPDIDRARWIVADPSIFYSSQAEAEGDPSSIYEKTYKKNKFYKMVPYAGVRSDITFVEWMMSDYWKGIAQDPTGIRLFIVCRNASDRPQPGMHPYDCPNLLWEMRRARRVQLTTRQLLTKNPSEQLQDKCNHALDPCKYLTGTLRNPTAIDPMESISEEISKLDPFTANLRARFLMADLGKHGKLGPDGKPRSKAAPVIDLRKRPGVLPVMPR